MNPDAHSYEDLMMVCEDLQLPYKEKEETYRRLVFNILTTNVDAHIRNFSFMLEQGGSWHITPAYDLIFSCFNPHNRFDPDHYLKVRGKTSGITKEDLIAFGRYFSIKHPAEIISQVTDAVKQFRPLAQESKVESYWIDKIEEHFAEMSPDMLSSLEGYKPLVYEFHLEEEDIWVKDAHWTEMDNGAMRLTALLNDKPYRATFLQKSEKTKEIWKLGGTKMKMDDMKRYVLKYFVIKLKDDTSVN